MEWRRENDSDAFPTTVDLRTVASRPNTLSFLRIPPFPGARIECFVKGPHRGAAESDVLADRLARLRVGGNYWGTQPQLPGNHVLLRSSAASRGAEEVEPNRPVVALGGVPMPGITCVKESCDPWHLLSGAAALIAPADDELHVIAALMGIRRYEWHGVSQTPVSIDESPAALLARLAGCSFENPFTGEEMDALEAAELCGFWRQLVDSNRDIHAGVGFAFWKQPHIAPLMWGGSEPFRFLRGAVDAEKGGAIAVWRSKASTTVLRELERRGHSVIEVEDGFLRSQGLGADCIPPISITVDRLGAHFDPLHPSEIELLLQNGPFSGEMLQRARSLRHLIVEEGIGKYGRGTEVLVRPAGKRRHILVPGQVEDDRAVREGGCGLTSNLDLLKRVRADAPDAYILYKPHPDVVAGHRRGALPDAQCLRHADRIVGDVSIASLLAMVDEVHVNTSLAGFEALLRGKAVTTYGVPFYAGWGLTRDLGPVPARRTARRSIDELVAAALLLYPRYLDSVTGLPCPAEIAVARLCTTVAQDSLIVGARRLQGKVMRHLRRLVQ